MGQIYHEMKAASGILIWAIVILLYSLSIPSSGAALRGQGVWELLRESRSFTQTCHHKAKNAYQSDSLTQLKDSINIVLELAEKTTDRIETTILKTVHQERKRALKNNRNGRDESSYVRQHLEIAKKYSIKAVEYAQKVKNAPNLITGKVRTKNVIKWMKKTQHKLEIAKQTIIEY